MTRKEFTNMVMPSEGKLYRLAVSLLSDRREAEDTLQDTFLKLWTMRERLAEYKSVEALAVTITKNLCMDKLRSYRHRMQDATEPGTMAVKNASPDPAKEAELSETAASIQSIMQALPDRQRLVMHLRDIEHYSYDEIEQLTGLSRNAVRVNLSRARKSVRREYLKKQNYEHGKD